MRRLASSVLLMGALCISVLAAKKGKDEDFPLQIHIVRVDMAQGQTGVSGSGSTDSNGNYSSHVSGGESYLYHVYTIHVDGDNRELTMTTPAAHFKGGKGLALATMGWSAIATARRNSSLHMGDYNGHWNKDGSLEIQFVDEKGKLAHQPFYIRAEAPLPTTTPATTTAQAPGSSQQ
jgi:hypothetical protein